MTLLGQLIPPRSGSSRAQAIERPRRVDGDDKRLGAVRIPLGVAVIERPDANALGVTPPVRNPPESIEDGDIVPRQYGQARHTFTHLNGT